MMPEVCGGMLNLDEIRRHAFVDHGPASLQLTQEGPLAGLTFAVKDLFDIAGFKTACGNPDRLRDNAPAVATAPSVLTALAAGAICIGKTHTDEVACGMFGTNAFFGTPINPGAPDRVPGGSSAGSVSAVGAGLCDFALGTDTGGSVRVPASFCGTFGLRTTFGRISVAGVMAMAPSFDTVGWFTRTPEMMRRVSEVYLGPMQAKGKTRLLLARDAFDIPNPRIVDKLLPAAQALGPDAEIELFLEGIPHWLATFRPIQLYDLWAALGDWWSVPGRRVSQSIHDRMMLAKSVNWQDVSPANLWREALAGRLADLLGDDGVIMIPTAHDLPPLREDGPAALVEFRDRTLALTCIASLCRLPQINIPAVKVDGVPVGLSFIAGPRGEDRLVAMAAQWSAALPEGKALA